MTEFERHQRRRTLLYAVDAEMLAVHERVMSLLHHAGTEDAFDVQMQVASSLDQLVQAVDHELGYFERPRADGDRVVLVNRSGRKAIESTYPLAEWRIAGPRILTAALERWAAEGGQVQLSGSWSSGRNHGHPRRSAGQLHSVRLVHARDRGARAVIAAADRAALLAAVVAVVLLVAAGLGTAFIGPEWLRLYTPALTLPVLMQGLATGIRRCTDSPMAKEVL